MNMIRKQEDDKLLGIILLIIGIILGMFIEFLIIIIGVLFLL